MVNIALCILSVVVFMPNADRVDTHNGSALRFHGRVSNDDCGTAEALGGPPTSTSLNTSGATDDDLLFCDVSGPDLAVWYTVVGTGYPLSASTCHGGTDFDTSIHIYCGACDGLVCVAGNDDADGPACELGGLGRKSHVTWCSEVGRTYYIVVGGAGGQSGNFTLQITEDSGTPCDDPVPCEDPACWPCCFIDNDDMRCELLSATACAILGGVFHEGVAKCTHVDCDYGACCNAGMCSITSYDECDGAFVGGGTTCLPDNPCPPPPDNDTCEDAGPISCNVSITADNTHASDGSGDDPPFPCAWDAGPYGSHTLWYTFQATADTVEIQTCNTDDPVVDTVIGLYSGPCGDLQPIACGEDECPEPNAYPYYSRICASGLVVDHVYYIQVASGPDWAGGVPGPITLDVACPCPDDYGACCNYDTMGDCVEGTEHECMQTPEGVFLGACTVCGGQPAPCGSGACCLADGSCMEGAASACVDGSYQGGGTTCASVTCPPPGPSGACCVGDVCSVTDESACGDSGGNYLGDGTDCSGSPCDNGACCVAGLCSLVGHLEPCEGTYIGGMETCDPNPCAPGNDDCSDAWTVSDGTTPFSSVNATTDGLPHVECLYLGDQDVQSDVWFVYEATCNGTAIINTCGSAYDTKMAVYDDTSCPTEVLPLVCNDDAEGEQCPGSLQSAAVVPGVFNESDYLIRVGGFEGATGAGVLNIECLTATEGACCDSGACEITTETTCEGVFLGLGTSCLPNPCPANDVCDDAEPVDVASGSGSVTMDNTWATTDGNDPAFSCAVGAGEPPGRTGYGTLWYTFVPPANSALLSTCTSYDDTILAVYTGTCGSLSETACNDDTCGLRSAVCVENLSQGEQYYVQVASWSQESVGEITLDITSPCPSLPPNDECAYAASLTVPVSGITSAEGANDVALADVTPVCGTDTPGGAVWYAVAGTGNTLTATTCNPGTDFDTALQVFCRDCDNPICVAGNDDQAEEFDPACDTIGVGANRGSTATWCSESGSTYWIVVGGFASATGEFTLTVTDDGTLCDDAIPCHSVGQDDCQYGDSPPEIFDGVTPFVTTAATTDGPPCGMCAVDGQVYKDTWYAYTATCTGTMTVSTCNAADFDTVVAVYAASTCPATSTRLLGCNDDTSGCSGLTSEATAGVIAGLRYLIRLGGATAWDTGTGTLTIECETAGGGPEPPVSDPNDSPSDAIGKVRYVSFVPGDPLGAPQAFRVRLPVDGSLLEMWVQQPVGGIAELGCEPHFTLDWGAGVLDVEHCDIAAGMAYYVQAIHEGDDVGDARSYSPPLPIHTNVWGDVDGEWNVDLNDIIGVLDAYAGSYAPQRPRTAWFDLAPCRVDGALMMEDILAVLDAFERSEFPCALPEPGECDPDRCDEN